MVRLSVEVDLPATDGVEFSLAMKLLCEQCPHWKLLSIERTPQEPPCPSCGCPMQWDRAFAGYVCHHPE